MPRTIGLRDCSSPSSVSSSIAGGGTVVFILTFCELHTSQSETRGVGLKCHSTLQSYGISTRI